MVVDRKVLGMTDQEGMEAAEEMATAVVVVEVEEDGAALALDSSAQGTVRPEEDYWVGVAEEADAVALVPSTPLVLREHRVRLLSLAVQ